MQSILKSIAFAAIGAILALIIEVLVFGLMQGVFQGHEFYREGRAGSYSRSPSPCSDGATVEFSISLARFLSLFAGGLIA